MCSGLAVPAGHRGGEAWWVLPADAANPQLNEIILDLPNEFGKRSSDGSRCAKLLDVLTRVPQGKSMIRLFAGAGLAVAAIGFLTLALIPGPSGVVVPTAAFSQCPPGWYVNSSGNCIEPPDQNQNNATAICCDGSESHSQHRSGTCSRHGGVCQWNSLSPGFSDTPDPGLTTGPGQRWA